MDKQEEKELVLKHMGLVLSHANSYKENGIISREDYIQVALIGLLKAIRKFDPTKSQLQTYAWPFIRNELITAYNKAKKKSHVQFEQEPSYSSKESVYDLLPKLTDEEYQIVQYKIEGYTLKEIAILLDMKQKEIKEILSKIYSKVKKSNE